MYRYKVAPRFPDHEFWRRIVQREASFDATARDTVVALGAMWMALEREQNLCRAARRAEERATQLPLPTSLSESDPGLLSGGDRSNISLSPESATRSHITTAGRSNSSHTTDDIVQANLCEARRHYARAMSAFRTRLARDGASMSARSIFIATYLFVIFEQIQGHTAEADRLLIFGISLLKRHLSVFRRSRTNISCSGGRLSPAEGDSPKLESDIGRAGESESELAARLDDGGLREAERCFVHMAAVQPAGQRIRGAGGDDIGGNLARQILEMKVPALDDPVDHLLVDWDLFISRSGLWMFRLAPTSDEGVAAISDKEGNPQTDDASARSRAKHPCEKAEQVRQTILTKYAVWRTVFEHKLAVETDMDRRAALGAATICQMMSFMCFTCLPDRSEMEWDAFIPDCRTAVAALEVEIGHELAHREDNRDGHSKSGPDSAVAQHYESLRFPALHPLYFVAQKCREASTRRRAVALLRMIADREESWHIKLLTAGCEAHVAAEERWRDRETGEIASGSRFGWTSYAWNPARTRIVVTMPPVAISGIEKKVQIVYLKPDDIGSGITVG